jgi:hypothetical protein
VEPTLVRAPAMAGLEVTVLSRDCQPIADADLRRLFPGSALTDQRLDRIREWPRVLVALGPTIVGAATCQRIHDELLAPDVGVCATCSCSAHDVLHALLDALETACLAGGSHRVVLSPPPASLSLLDRRGYRTVKASCAGSWVEKTLG